MVIGELVSLSLKEKRPRRSLESDPVITGMFLFPYHASSFLSWKVDATEFFCSLAQSKMDATISEVILKTPV